MNIRIIMATFLLVFFFNLKAQTPSTIVKYFKNKNVENVVKNCSFDFDLRLGGDYDTTINNEETLKKILVELFQEPTLDRMLKGKIIVNNSKKITYESRQFNEKGELESESTISFYFKKVKGKYKLYSIVLAG